MHLQTSIAKLTTWSQIGLSGSTVDPPGGLSVRCQLWATFTLKVR